MPAKAKPAMASSAVGAMAPSDMPIIAMTAQMRKVVTAPRRLRMWSPRKRMIAMVPENAA